MEHHSPQSLFTSLQVLRVSVTHLVGKESNVAAVSHAILNRNSGSKMEDIAFTQQCRGNEEHSCRK